MRAHAYDIAIIGAGACGSLLAKRLAERGAAVVVLEAGNRYDAGTDLRNSEANAAKIMWTEPRVYTGAHPIVPKTGVGVGGGTLTWLGVMPRFHPEDFRTQSSEGVGDDWPISYEDLREHYARVEREFGVAGECGPFAPERYELPMPPHRMNWHARVLSRGARAMGAHPFAPPVGINSMPYDGRPACVYCGWCGSGCPTEAKATGLNVYLSRAEKLGATVIPSAFVYRIEYDAPSGRVTGICYLNAQGAERRVNARVVILAAHAIENPRLLLSSANGTFPQGLANSSGLVGRRFMSHPTWQVFGLFDEPINAYKGMQMGHVMVQDYYRPDPRNDYRRGYVLISYMMTPITYSNLSGSFHGIEFKQFLHNYPYTAAWWAHAEGLPSESNTVTLDPEVKDTRGLPAARITYEWSENDLAVSAAARDKAAELMRASGAKRVHIGLNYGAHAMGSCRMGDDAATSVVNPFGRSHDVANLFICDTSVFVTGTGLNPTLTAMAIADRAADYMYEAVKNGEL